jgi:GNAT superfamily N-acetyltransferase
VVRAAPRHATPRPATPRHAAPRRSAPRRVVAGADHLFLLWTFPHGTSVPGRAKVISAAQANPLTTEIEVHPVTHSAPALRRASIENADAVADVWLQSFAAALPSVRLAHTETQVRSWIRDVVIAGAETWILDLAGQVVGMMSIADDDIDQLYLDPSWRGKGLGGLLVAHAKSLRPAGLRLWTFQVNTPAIRFYERHGFRETQRTDGSNNEEREPDVRMEWTP